MILARGSINRGGIDTPGHNGHDRPRVKRAVRVWWLQIVDACCRAGRALWTAAAQRVLATQPSVGGGFAI